MPRATKTAQREALFVAAYLAHRNSAKAAEVAGYSKRTAKQKGYELLKRPHVKAAIDAAQLRITTKYEVTTERTVEEMAVIGYSSLRNYRFDDDGWLELVDGAPDSAIRAVKKIRRKLRLIPQRISTDNPDGKPIREIESEFELWSKDAQLRNIGEYLKLFKENRADDTPEDDDLTPDQRKERIIQLLRVAASRKKTTKRAG